MKTLYRLNNSLAATRNRLGLTQAQMAMHLGVSASMVKQVETNRRRLTSDKLAKMAALEIIMSPGPTSGRKELPPSMQSFLEKATEREERNMAFRRQGCMLQASKLEKKLKKMEANYEEIRQRLEMLDTIMKENGDNSNPILQHLSFSRFKLEHKLKKCSLQEQDATRKKIALLRAEAALNTSIHTGHAYTSYETPIIQNLKFKNMSYTLSLIENRADCQAMIDNANDDKGSLMYRKTGLERQKQGASDTTFDIAAELAAVTAEIAALESIIATLPEGTVKENNKVSLTKAQYKKFLLDQRKGNYGSVALVGKEYDIAVLDQAIAETDAFIAALTTRFNELPSV